MKTQLDSSFSDPTLQIQRTPVRSQLYASIFWREVSEFFFVFTCGVRAGQCLVWDSREVFA
ncbi:MAG: hypothetical protein R3C68_14495 [Myxococcota bacterium]